MFIVTPLYISDLGFPAVYSSVNVSLSNIYYGGFPINLDIQTML